VYDGITYEVKQGAGDRGITAEDMQKSQHTDLNKDTTNKTLMWPVAMWKLDTQKEWSNTSWRIWDESAEKDSAGFVDIKENKWVGS